MDISIFLAQVFGLYFILAGVAILVRPGSTIELLQLFTNRDVSFLSGFIALMVGVPLVLLHNIWDGTWHVVITLLVWLTFLKGFTIIFAPELVASWINTLSTYPRIVRHMIWVPILVGLYLLSIGFGWTSV